LPATGADDAKYFVMEGRGWLIKKKEIDRSVIELQKQSEFYVYSTKNTMMNLSMKVNHTNGTKNIMFRGDTDAMQKNVVIGADGLISFSLNVVGGRLNKYLLSLDGNPILVENPRIR